MKKLLIISACALMGVFSANARPLDLGAKAGSTPYDAYMRPVRRVLSQLDGGTTSMEQVRALMRKGRNFRYSFDQPYVALSPEVTEARRAGDCKDKALWLADQIGDPNIRFVVGKARSDSAISHAWLLWKKNGRYWVLDCTNKSQPIPMESVSRNEYIPMYSWSRGGTYRHAATRAMNNSPIANR